MRRYLILTIAILAYLPSKAEWQLPIINYSIKDTNAGRQNWKITEGNGGLIFFANNNGLLEYSDIGWHCHSIDGGAIVRATLATTDGRIYSGALSEFGYFAPDNTGCLQYTSLVDSLEAPLLSNEIWDIHQVAKQTLLRSRREIIAINDNKITTMASDGLILASCTMNQNMYFATANGIFAVGEGAPLPISINHDIPYDQICAMTDVDDDKILIATNFNGLYIYSKNSIRPFATQADSELFELQPFCLASNQKYIACGTVRGGIILMSHDGELEAHISTSNGLMNNTVLCAMFDSNQNLWCGLDDGIACIATDTPIKHYNTSSNDIFSGYCSIIKGDYLYMGTNQGLLRISTDPTINTAPEIVNNSMGQIWSLTQLGEQIYCCHTRGLFTLEERGQEAYLHPIYTDDGAWGITPIDESNYIISTYEGVLLMNHSAPGNYHIEPIEEYDGSAQHIALHPQSQSIFALDDNGLTRLQQTTSPTNVSAQTIIHDNSYSTKMLTIQNELIIYTPECIYTVDNNGDIVATNKYDHLLPPGNNYTLLKVDKEENLWSINKGRLSRHEYNHSTKSYAAHSVQFYEERYLFIPRFSMIENIDERYYIINSTHGFSIIDSEWKPTHKAIDQPMIYGLYDTKSGDSLLMSNAYGRTTTAIELPYSQNSLRIVFGNNSTNNQSAKYSFRLRGYDNEWSEWHDQILDNTNLSGNQKEYTSLREGNYYFDLRILSRDTSISESSLRITIRPPWQRSMPMIALYIMVFIIAAIYARYRVIRHFEIRRRLSELQNEHEYEKSKREFESKAIEQENNIIRLKNKSLESEIALKSSELSNLLLNKLEKNDIIINVKEELEKIRVEMVNRRFDNVSKRISTLGRRLDDKMLDNVDWHAFETNFNTINDNFASKLSEHYGWMNLNERKLCIYIKMGFQNKEIAPLLNLSTRGVEMLRFRVRKKLELDRHRSLHDFLQAL